MLLIVVWSGAPGVLFRVFWGGAPRWLYMPVLHDARAGSPSSTSPASAARRGRRDDLGRHRRAALQHGAIVYGTKRPNPSPRWFGFHEVFHSLTILAFTAHFVAATLALTGPAIA